MCYNKKEKRGLSTSMKKKNRQKNKSTPFFKNKQKTSLQIENEKTKN